MAKGNYCPLIKKDCIEHKCKFFYHVSGKNPNTGKDVEEWQCAVNLVPLLLIELGRQQNSTAAAVESFRNEAVTRNDTTNTLLYHLSQQPNLIEPVRVETLPSGD